MHFIRQRETTTCGCVAVYNLLKAVGIKVSERRDMPWIKKLCKWQNGIQNTFTRSYVGVEVHDLQYALDQLGFYTSDGFSVPALSLTRTIAHLEDNGLIIFLYSPVGDAMHYVFIPELKSNKIVIVGLWGTKRNTASIAKRTFSKLLKTISYGDCTKNYPYAFFIQQVDEKRKEQIEKKVQEFRNDLPR